MRYLYGHFSHKQLDKAVCAMHRDIHKLLIYKDDSIEAKNFENDVAFLTFFKKVMYKFGGTKTLFNNNEIMVSLMSTLQAAMDEIESDNYDWETYRRAILDAHEYIRLMFEGGVSNAKPTNS